MAYDKIYTIRARLYDRICYILDPTKTTAPSGLVLVDTISCDPENIYQDMMHTKTRWDKRSGVQGYHLIHSYAPGEVTPEQAHALGVEFADRLVGDRFEAVIATHTDHDHLHCHIIFNSVSLMDGRKYRSDFKAYYGDIRGTSNDISQENGLSVIEPKGHSKHYAEWRAERTGKTTLRDLIRQDMDAAMRDAFTFQSFFAVLEKRGYAIKRGPNITHTAVRPPGGSRFIRLDSLGENYTEDDIRERLKDIRAGEKAEPAQPQKPFIISPTPKRYAIRRGQINHRPGQKLRGIRALYVRYLYILGIRGDTIPRKKPAPFNVRAEVRKLDRYKRQFSLMRKYRIDTDDQLSMLKGALQADYDGYTYQRQELHRRKRRGEDVADKITETSETMRHIRKELRLCEQISADISHIREQTKQYQQSQAKTHTTEKVKPRDRRTHHEILR